MGNGRRTGSSGRSTVFPFDSPDAIALCQKTSYPAIKNKDLHIIAAPISVAHLLIIFHAR